LLLLLDFLLTSRLRDLRFLTGLFERRFGLFGRRFGLRLRDCFLSLDELLDLLRFFAVALSLHISNKRAPIPRFPSFEGLASSILSSLTGSGEGIRSRRDGKGGDGDLLSGEALAARGLAGGDSVNFLLRSAEVLLLFKNAYDVSASVSSITRAAPL